MEQVISFMIKFIIMYLILSKLYFGHIRFLIASSGVLLAAVRGITLFVISFFRLLLFRLRGLIIKLVSMELIHFVILCMAFPSAYSSVPNRCVGQNKRAGGKILKKH